MGLLDDLKKQAEAKLQAPSSEAAKAGKNHYFQAVQNALKEMSSYFSELAASLNVVKPDVRRQFYLEGSSRLSNLLQGDYSARDTRTMVTGYESLGDVSLRFTLVGDGKLTFEKETRQANVMKEYLWAYHLPFEHRDILDDNGRIVRSSITVISRVPASVTLTGDPDTGRMQLSLRNVEMLGEVKQTFDVGDINKDFFEEIGKVVLAQPNGLRNFGRPADAPLPASFAPPR